MHPSRTIDNLQVKTVAIGWIPPVANTVFDDRIEVTNAILAAFSSWPQNRGQLITDYPAFNSTLPGPCIPCNKNLRAQVRLDETKDVMQDDARESAVYAKLSRKMYSSGLSNITGISIIHVGQGCPVGLTSLKYEFATNSMFLSVDGGVTYSIPIPVPAIGEYSYAVSIGVEAAAVYFEVTGALPGADAIDALVIDDTRWTVMYQSLIAGTGGGSPVASPFVVPAGSNIYIVLPFFADFGSIPITDQLSQLDMAFIQLDPVYQVGGGTGFSASGPLVIPAQNTFTLPGVPSLPAATQLFVLGGFATYGVDYTLAGATGTWLPAAAGFNLETTDAGRTMAFVY